MEASKMARPVNRKCIECARLRIEEARQHPCWTDDRQLCYKRRSHYLRRGDRNISRRVQYRSSRLVQEDFALSTMPTASVILVIYSEQPHHFKSSETPVHAVGAELWVGSFNEAEPLYLRSIELTKKAVGVDSIDLAMYLDYLTSLYVSLKRYEEAQETCEQVLELTA